jgi:hypothetical protein
MDQQDYDAERKRSAVVCFDADLTDVKHLNGKIFDEPDRRWQQFVQICRAVQSITPPHDYDWVIGRASNARQADSFAPTDLVQLSLHTTTAADTIMAKGMRVCLI